MKENISEIKKMSVSQILRHTRLKSLVWLFSIMISLLIGAFTAGMFVGKNAVNSKNIPRAGMTVSGYGTQNIGGNIEQHIDSSTNSKNAIIQTDSGIIIIR